MLLSLLVVQKLHLFIFTTKNSRTYFIVSITKLSLFWLEMMLKNYNFEFLNIDDINIIIIESKILNWWPQMLINQSISLIQPNNLIRTKFNIRFSSDDIVSTMIMHAKYPKQFLMKYCGKRINRLLENLYFLFFHNIYLNFFYLLTVTFQ